VATCKRFHSSGSDFDRRRARLKRASPYKRSNWHVTPMKRSIIYWQALEFLVDWTARKRGTPPCDAPAIEVVPFVYCELR
jgi:hypothetical protein